MDTSEYPKTLVAERGEHPQPAALTVTRIEETADRIDTVDVVSDTTWLRKVTA